MKTFFFFFKYKFPAFLHQRSNGSTRQHPLQQFIPLKDLPCALKTTCTHTRSADYLVNPLNRFPPFQYLFSHKRLKSPTWEFRRLKREKTSESSHLGISLPSSTSLRNFTDNSKLDILLDVNFGPIKLEKYFSISTMYFIIDKSNDSV